MMIRTVHVVPRITHEASGPSYSVVRLCKALCNEDTASTLAVLDSLQDSPRPDYVKSFPVSRFPARLGRSKTMFNWLRDEVDNGGLDIVHNHSLWMMPNIYPGIVTRNTKVALFVSPRGTLSNWSLSRSKWVKRVFWYTMQSHSISHAACFHATAEHEYNDIRQAGFRQPVCIIPNGIDIPSLDILHKPTDCCRKMMFLGRIHPVKGVDLLLHAWGIVSPKFHEWELHIVGPDNAGYLSKMKAISQKLKLERIVFRGPLYGKEKIEAYQEAELCVLPSHSENFGMTVAESLATGTPVIVTKGAPWSGLEQRDAGWWIEIGVDPLVTCLEDALSQNIERLAEMGDAGKKWMQDDFSWDTVGNMMYQTYQWVLNGGSRPLWVRD